MITPEEVFDTQDKMVPDDVYKVIDQLIALNYNRKQARANVKLSDIYDRLKVRYRITDDFKRIVNFAIDGYKRNWEVREGTRVNNELVSIDFVYIG